jgi:hypothetical protein
MKTDFYVIHLYDIQPQKKLEFAENILKLEEICSELKESSSFFKIFIKMLFSHFLI